ncbi:MAG: hypothetical protein HWN65_21960 [Candidatus Helarchaeota archaeon]|nr:hypothetical protein [Candidatus Helarchaeota archaeon]
MSHWSEKELKLLKKLVKKNKSTKEIAKQFEKKGFNKNIFMIISKVRSLPELRPYYQNEEWTLNDLGKFADLLKKRKKPLELE